MQNFRRTLLRHRSIAVLLIACAMALRLAVPAGFMPSAARGRIVVVLCGDAGATRLALDTRGEHENNQPQDGHRLAETPCLFAGLGSLALASVDELVVDVAPLFEAEIATWVIRRALKPVSRSVRPPVRGPPLVFPRLSLRAF